MKRLILTLSVLLFFITPSDSKEAPIWWGYASMPGHFGSSFDQEIIPSIRDGWFVVNDEPVLLKGVTYSSLPPDLLEGETQRTPEELERDIRLIKEAGFNCVRVCEATSDELAAFRAAGLLVLQQVWVDPEADLANSRLKEDCAQRMIRVARQSRPYGNVIGYLVMSDPAIMDARSPLDYGKAEVFFRAMAAALREGDPKARIGLAEPPELAPMNHSFYDFLAVNNTPFADGAMGRRAMNEWLIKTIAGARPLICTEYGASGKSSQSGLFYGGLSPSEQRDRALYDLDAAVNAESLGFFYLDWKDERWRMEIPQAAQEREGGLFGLIDENHHPRPAYEALADAHWSVVTEPRGLVSYPGGVPVNVYCEPGIERVTALVDGGTEIELDHLSLHWWVTLLNVEDGYHDLLLSEGSHSLVITAYDANGFCRKSVERTFVVSSPAGSASDRVVALRAPQLAPWQGEIAVRITVTDGLGRPVPNAEVSYACEFHGRPEAVRNFTGRTNASGVLNANISLGMGYHGYATITAGVDGPPIEGQTRRAGDQAFVLIQ